MESGALGFGEDDGGIKGFEVDILSVGYVLVYVRAKN